MKKILFIIFLCISASLRATNYYVRTDGSNSNNGLSNTSGGAWLTVAYACSQVSAGAHTIYVGAGTFNESTNRMNLAAGVSITGVSQASTIIISSYVAPNYLYGALYLYSASVTDGNQTISNLTFQGNNRTGTRGICVRFRNNVIITNCTIENWKYSGVGFQGNDNVMGGAPSVAYSSGNSVYNCTLNNCASYDNAPSCGNPVTGEGNNGIDINGQTGCAIYSNTITQNQLTAGYNGKCIGGDWNINLKIHDCILTKADENASTWNFIFELWHWVGGGEIYNCTFNGAGVVDIVDVAIGASTYGLKIYNNTFTSAAQYPHGTCHDQMSIALEERGHCDYVYIYNNHFKNVPQGIILYAPNSEYTTYAVSCQHINIYYNIFENIGYTDYTSYPISMSTENLTGYGLTISDININNNVIIGAGSGVDCGIRWNHTETISNITIDNNIIQGFSNAYPIRFWENTGTAGQINTLNINNNIFYGNSSNTILFTNVNTSSYTHNNNLTSNPTFVSTTDFHLQNGSPGINTGLHIAALTTDYSGAAVSNPPEIGAYEMPSLVQLTTTALSVIWSKGGVSGGTITSDGGSTITARGVCWNTSANPTVSNSHTTDGSGTGAFTSLISPLVKSTTYHVRAYATNSAGTSYGSDISFTTPAYTILGTGSALITSGGLSIKIE
jgi:hypothetical protein